MATRVSTDWKYRGFQSIIMENSLLRVVILPELGAKLWQIIYKPRDVDMLWQHPRLGPRQVSTHAIYDDNFFGGWDELFPNDIPEVLDDEQMPDHGEIWTLPWHYEVSNDTVHLWVETVVSSCRLDKWITLRDGEATLKFRHQITNTGQKVQPFLWKLHAALRVDQHSRLDMGAKTVLMGDFGPPRTGEAGFTYEWPYANGHDMRQLLPMSAQVNEFQFATEMNAGWCAVTHAVAHLGLGLAFDISVFPSCWTFATFGGWRNLNTVVLEPCTGYPVSVNEGLQQGTHRLLQPGETIETEVLCVVYEGLREVHHIDATGHVAGV